MRAAAVLFFTSGLLVSCQGQQGPFSLYLAEAVQGLPAGTQLVIQQPQEPGDRNPNTGQVNTYNQVFLGNPTVRDVSSDRQFSLNGAGNVVSSGGLFGYAATPRDSQDPSGAFFFFSQPPQVADGRTPQTFVIGPDGSFRSRPTAGVPDKLFYSCSNVAGQNGFVSLKFDSGNANPNCVQIFLTIRSPVFTSSTSSQTPQSTSTAGTSASQSPNFNFSNSSRPTTAGNILGATGLPSLGADIGSNAQGKSAIIVLVVVTIQINVIAGASVFATISRSFTSSFEYFQTASFVVGDITSTLTPSMDAIGSTLTVSVSTTTLLPPDVPVQTAAPTVTFFGDNVPVNGIAATVAANGPGSPAIQGTPISSLTTTTSSQNTLPIVTALPGVGSSADSLRLPTISACLAVIFFVSSLY